MGAGPPRRLSRRLGPAAGTYTPGVPTEERRSTGRAVRVLRVLLAIGAVAFGLLLIAAAAVFGDCAAFGGRCPASRPPRFDDDVFTMAGLGAALVVAVPIVMRRPSWRSLGIAVAAGLAAGVIVGELVASAAHG